MNGATSLETGLVHDIPALLVERVTMAAMSDYCPPFAAVLVNTVVINGLSRQLDGNRDGRWIRHKPTLRSKIVLNC